MGGVRLSAVAWLVAGLGLVGCGDDFAIGRNIQRDTYTQSPSVEVDVVFVVDDSSSMLSAQEKVKQAFQSFAESLEDFNSNFHIGVTTTDTSSNGLQGAMLRVTVDGKSYPYISNDMPNYPQLFETLINQVGTSGSVFEAGLEASSRAILPASKGGVGDTANAGFLRDDATLAVIWVSDEDDCSNDGTIPASEPAACYDNTYASSLIDVYGYVEDYYTVKKSTGKVILGAVVGVDPGSEICEGISVARGDRYIEAVGIVGGVVGDICSGDFSVVMEELGLNAAGQRTVFLLSKTPDPVTLKVEITPAGGDTYSVARGEGWEYLADQNAVSFYGEYVPPRDSTVEITYEVVNNAVSAE